MLCAILCSFGFYRFFCFADCIQRQFFVHRRSLYLCRNKSQPLERCDEQPANSRCSYKSRLLKAVNEIFRIARSIRDNSVDKNLYMASECSRNSHEKLPRNCDFWSFSFCWSLAWNFYHFASFLEWWFFAESVLCVKRLKIKFLSPFYRFVRRFLLYSFNVFLVIAIFTCFWY